MKRCIKIFAVLCMISAVVLLAGGDENAAGRADPYAPDPLNATYLIEGRAVRLKDGYCQLLAVPGSAMMARTSVFGKPVYRDIDGDGDEDVTLFLAHYPDGSGTFFYVAVALNESGNYRRTNAVLLGDRIRTKNLKIRNSVVVANYFDRSPQESMVVLPSIDKSKHIVLERNTLIEIRSNMPTFGNRGTLILKKDNPTDLPEHDDELEITFHFACQDSMDADPWQKITFDVSGFDESGLYGPPSGKRALSYGFCIPESVQNRLEVKAIDPTVTFFAQSPGRIGCGKDESLCVGSTHQKGFKNVLQRLVELPYVQRIDESFFE